MHAAGALRLLCFASEAGRLVHSPTTPLRLRRNGHARCGMLASLVATPTSERALAYQAVHLFFQ